MDGGDAVDGADGGDPFDDLRLDDEFVRAASIKEPSASVRGLLGDRKVGPVAQLESARRARQSRRAKRLFRRSVAVVIVAAIGAATWISYFDRRDAATVPRTSSHPDVASSDVSLTAGLPPPSAEEQAAPIGHPPALPAAAGPYRFVRLQPSGSAPVAYDPCRPVHVVVNAATAPRESGQLLHAALERLNETTGLRFVEDGPTTEGPSANRAPYQPERYPGSWAPVLVAWSDPAGDNRLDGNTAGYGGSISITTPSANDSVYVTGEVVLDGPQLDDLLGEPGGAAAARSVILHELGHLVGLDHVDDRSQIMNPIGSPTVTDYADGDRAGLALLGQGHCFPTL